MPFTDISDLELWQPLCSMEQTHLFNFKRKHYKATIVRNYFEFGSVVQEEMTIKEIFILNSYSPYNQRSLTICAILVEGITRKNYVKLF